MSHSRWILFAKSQTESTPDRFLSGRTKVLPWLTVPIVCLLAASLAWGQPEEEQPDSEPAAEAPADEEEGLPTLEELSLPTVEELLTGKKRDWILLNVRDEVLIVESLVPRPGTIEHIEEQIKEKEEARRRSSTREEREEIQEELNELKDLAVILPVEGSPEFKLPLNRILEIRHHEDLMLRKIDELLEEKNIEQSLELLTRLKQEWDEWEGMEEAQQKILFVDGTHRIDEDQPESALVVLDELYRTRKDYPRLSAQLGRAIRMLTEQALDEENYLKAQYFLNFLHQRYPDHEVFKRFEEQLAAKTNEAMQRADAAAAEGNYRQATIEAEQAVRIWPRTSGIRGPHRTHTERYQRLHVGVVHLPGENPAYPLPSDAEVRQQRLTELPLFEIDRVRDGTAYYRTRFFNEWEPFDLGREMRFTLKQFRQPAEMHNVLTSPDVVLPILQRIDPTHPLYDERLAAFIDSVIVESPTTFTLTFQRVPPRLEPLLARISLATPDEENDALGPLTDPGGFEVLEQTDEEIVYRRKLEQPDDLPKYHVAEIVEHKYSTYEKAVQALHRGEISMLFNMPDWILRRMQNDEEFLKRYFVQQMMLPETHLLQFNPASKPLRVRELRTALAYAVDRQTLLRETVLRDPRARHGRTITTPFLSSSPGRNVLVQPRRYDLSSSLAMLIAAGRKLESDVPKLTMVVAPGPVAEEAAEMMVNVWRRLGLEIDLVRSTDPPPERWDILYRTLQMTEPLAEMWPFLTFQDRARLSDLDDYPDWLKQELVELDRTSDQGRAITALQTLHRHLANDTAYIPLWEIDRFVVLRRNVQGFPQRPVHPYFNIDRWSMEAWFQTELP
jgi:ABC-type transport system substrate-binding protein